LLIKTRLEDKLFKRGVLLIKKELRK